MTSFTQKNDDSVNTLIANAMERMTSLWDEIGTAQADRDSVSESLKEKLAACVAEVELNETMIRDGKQTQIKQACEDYHKKACMLQKTSCDIEDTRDGETLTDAVMRTEESVSMITEEFEKILVVHENLLQELHTLYDTLNGTNQPYDAQFADVGAVLSEARQTQLEQEIKTKANEKKLRVDAREKHVTEWEELVDELCLTPEGAMDVKMSELKDLMHDETAPQLDVELPIGLTIVDLAAIGDRISELNELKQERFEQITNLGQQITQLWNKLEVTQEERDAFFERNDGQLGMKEIEACTDEVARLVQLKKERIHPMMIKERQDISELWEKLHYSTEQKKAFMPSFELSEDLFTEESVDKHEQYHEKLDKQYQIQEPIMQKIEKREKLLTIPSKLAEPLPKKGDLHAETGKKYTSGEIGKITRQRAKWANMYKKVLPKLETELVAELTEWKSVYGTDIIIDGHCYLEITNESIADRENAGAKKRNALKSKHMEKFVVEKKVSTLKRSRKA
jgi:protein regulator of cytokinesis 1